MKSNVILQSNDSFDELAEFDDFTNRYRFLSKKTHPELSAARAAGSYSRVEGTIVSLHRKNAELVLRIGNREFEITPDVSSTLTQEDNCRVFRLFHKQDLLDVFKYSPRFNEVPLALDPTPFIEDEDFDFLLFVHHVLTEAGRRDRVYRN